MTKKKFPKRFLLFHPYQKSKIGHHSCIALGTWNKMIALRD
eukprot:14891.XXX_1154340_1154462_1 [CDS] Oithona nana genome sequencing.